MPQTDWVTAQNEPAVDQPRSPFAPSLRPVSNVPAPPPGFLRPLGAIALVTAVIVGAVNTAVVWLSVGELREFGGGESGVRLLWLNAAVGLAVSAILFLAGLGLVLRRPWGRSLCFLFFVGAGLGFSYMACNGKISGYVASAEAWQAGASGVGKTQFLAALLPFAGPLSVVLCVFMLLPSTRAWARGVPLPVAASAPSRTSVMAVLSMILSFLPCLLFPPLLSLLFGAVSLRSIRRSEGKLRGEPLAWVGVFASSFFLMFATGLALAIGVACLMVPPKMIVDGMDIVEAGIPPRYYDQQSAEHSTPSAYDDRGTINEDAAAHGRVLELP